jgi:HEAT repeat protein
MGTLALFLALVLSDDKEAEDAIQAFRSSMKSPEVARRAAAVTELGRLQHEKIMKVLASCLVTDDKVVRIAAAKALGASRDKKASATAVLAIALDGNLKDAEVQAAILTAVGHLHEDSGLIAALRHIDDKNVKVAESAIGVTETIPSRNSIEPLIRLMKKLIGAGDGISSGDGSFDVPPDEQLRERARLLQGAAEKALHSITGESHSTPHEWDLWWKRNASTFKVKN